MKKLLSLSAALALVLSLSACGGKNGQTENPTDISSITADQLKGVEIEYWHAQSGPNGVAMDALVKEFNNTNEWGIKVKSSYQGSYNDIDTKITSALVAGTEPNIAQGYGNNIIGYMQSGKVLCLNDYIENETWGMTDEEFNDILPAYRKENSAYPDGKMYSLPIAKSSEILYYNKTFFEENNLTVPTTWAEVYETAKKATEITGKPSFGVDSQQNLFITGIQQYGAEFTSPTGELLFGNEANIDKAAEFVTFWQKGVADGYFRLAGEDKYMSGPFSNGDVPMFVGSTSGTAHVKPNGFEWAVAAYPTYENGEFKVMQQGGNIFALKSKDPVEELASYLFLEWLTGTEASAYYAANSGYLPARTSSYETETWKEFEKNGGPLFDAKVIVQNYPADSFIYDAIFKDSYPVRKGAGTIMDDATLNPTNDAKTIITDQYNKLVK